MVTAPQTGIPLSERLSSDADRVAGSTELQDSVGTSDQKNCRSVADRDGIDMSGSKPSTDRGSK